MGVRIVQICPGMSGMPVGRSDCQPMTLAAPLLTLPADDAGACLWRLLALALPLLAALALAALALASRAVKVKGSSSV